MRILHVADFVSERLGYQEFLLAKWNARHGHDVHIVTSNLNPSGPSYKDSFQDLLGPRVVPRGMSVHGNVTFHRIPAILEVRSRILLPGLERACIGVRPDVIFVHGSLSPTALQATHAGTRAKIPVFMDNHMVFSVMDDSRVGRLAYSAARFLMKHYLASRVVRFYGVAAESSDFLVRAQGAPTEKVSLLPLGVDSELFDFQPAKGRVLREALGLEIGDVLVAQTGKLDQSKDPLTLARAARTAMLEDPKVHILFLGTGPTEMMDRIRSVFSAPGLRARLHLRPAVPVEDLAGVFSACDIIVFPGGTSMSSLEAAACARVVVMNNQPASLWRESQGVGVTFREGDDKELASIITRFSEREELRESQGVAAREAVTDRFSYDAIARDLERDMQTALDAASKR